MLWREREDKSHIFWIYFFIILTFIHQTGYVLQTVFPQALVYQQDRRFTQNSSVVARSLDVLSHNQKVFTWVCLWFWLK